MAYKINKDICISCGQCATICPVAAAAFVDGEYKIDPAKCTSCGACAENCPVEAISQGN
ncbi:MAG: 4Fe-4S binding protein [Rickettsiales bacterium]|jgi:ferredoxin|nr:4Fe-4S binding protein [Rickettsiales bacterium]